LDQLSKDKLLEEEEEEEEDIKINNKKIKKNFYSKK